MTKPIIWAASEDVMFEDGVAPGTAFWDRGSPEGFPEAIMYVCPCGCGEYRRLPIATGDKQPGSWKWDGNETSPTITPSIQHVRHKPSDCNWHGFITAGQWVTV